MLLHVAFSQVQHCGRMFPACTPQTLAVAGQVRPMLSGVSLGTHLLWSASWRLCAHFRFLIFTLSFAAFSCCTRHGSHRSFLCFSFCFKQSSGEQAGRAHGANSVTGGLSTAGMRALHSSPISIPGMRAALFGGGVKAIIPVQLGIKKYREVLPSQPLMNVYRIMQ